MRDAQGNVPGVYDNNNTSRVVRQSELHLYGSSSLGLFKPNGNRAAVATNGIYTRRLGRKEYELTDHLGNVRAVIGDYRESEGGNIRVALRSYFNHYAFGLEMPGMVWKGGGYRYGYNGKEQDADFANNYDYGFRIYNPGVARFLSIDPLAANYPWYTPYQFAGNKPIFAVDLDGAEELPNEIFNRAKSYGVNLVKKIAVGYVIKKTEQYVNKKIEEKEEQLEDMINSGDPKKASTAMTVEFALGIGPEERDFGPDHPFTQSLKESHMTKIAVGKFYEGYENYRAGAVKSLQLDYSVSFPNPPKTMGDAGPLEEYLSDGKFTAAQFLGSVNYFFKFDEKTKMLDITVKDTKNHRSLFLHLPGTDLHKRNENVFFGKTYQTYEFSFKLDEVRKIGREQMMGNEGRKDLENSYTDKIQTKLKQ